MEGVQPKEGVYDALNRLTQTIFADGTTNLTVYDDLGRVQFSVDARGTTNAFGYDAAGQRITVTNALGVPGIQSVSSYAYDMNGNQIYFTNALRIVTTNLYDALNRLTNVSYADGTKQITVFDAAGRRTAQVDQANITNWFGYDGLGRLTSVTNALGKATRYEYDETGNLLRQIDALNRTNVFEYDGLGRRTRRVLPGNQGEAFGYDPVGNLLYHTNFNGVVITNVYNGLNRLVARVYPDGTSNTFAYTATGQRETMTDGSGGYTYAYDVRDRLCTNTTPAGSLYYGYDANGNATNITSSTPGGTLVGYQYDALNRLTNVIDGRLSSRGNTGYGFDAAGNLVTVQYPNGVTNLYQYDALNRLTNLAWKLNASTLAGFSYQLGPAGNRTNLSETIGSTVNRSYAWSYDPLYRLTNETVSGSAPTGSLGYGYDDVGNRTNRSGSLGPLGAQTLSYGSNDWVTTDAYDNNGNTLWTSNGVATGPYAYDFEDRLTNFNNGQVVLTYNADGQRVKRVAGGVTTLYVVDTYNPSGYAQVLEELTVSGATTNLLRAYTYGLALISQRQPGVSTNFLGSDGHGSTRLLLDAAAGVAQTFAYDAYGTLVASNGMPSTVYLYCGEQFDPDLRFYYLRTRYLKPDLSRFWTADTSEGNQEDPLSLHRYLYAHDDPVENLDPNGTDAVTDVPAISLLLFDLWLHVRLSKLIPTGVEVVTIPRPRRGDVLDDTEREIRNKAVAHSRSEGYKVISVYDPTDANAQLRKFASPIRILHITGHGFPGGQYVGQASNRESEAFLVRKGSDRRFHFINVNEMFTGINFTRPCTIWLHGCSINDEKLYPWLKLRIVELTKCKVLASGTSTGGPEHGYYRGLPNGEFE